MTTTARPHPTPAEATMPIALVARVHGLKSVSPRRRCPVKVTPYELRAAPADRRHGTLRYGEASAVVTLASVTSGHGAPRWMQRAADRITDTATSIEEARGIVAEVFARRYADRRRPLQAPPPISPEATLRAAGIDDARQAAYQRKMSALLAGRGVEA